MPDFAVRLDPDAGRFDLVPARAPESYNGFATGGDLVTAVLASLFTWGRAAADDRLPDGGEDRKGYWADAFPAAGGRRVGSRLWLLSREIVSEETMERARQYARESLQWLIEDGIAARIDVEVARSQVNRVDMLIAIYRPAGQVLRVRHDNIWADLGKV